jgi:hypothetical protein
VRREFAVELLRKLVFGFILSVDFLAETFLRRLSTFFEGICRARLTKRSAPGFWPGATVESESLRRNPESLRHCFAV